MVRRERDSNPRYPCRGTLAFQASPFDRSGISPIEQVPKIELFEFTNQSKNQLKKLLEYKLQQIRHPLKPDEISIYRRLPEHLAIFHILSL